MHLAKGAHRHVADLLEVYVDALRKGEVLDVEIERTEDDDRVVTVFRLTTGGGR